MNSEIQQLDAEILVVDDIPANLKLLTSILSHRGYRVRPAASGNWPCDPQTTNRPT